MTSLESRNFVYFSTEKFTSMGRMFVTRPRNTGCLSKARGLSRWNNIS